MLSWLPELVLLTGAQPPAGLLPYLLALWYERRGDWNRAHEIVQDLDTREAAAVHAYLHRREGDESNARYWYRRANKPFPAGQSLDQRVAGTRAATVLN